MPITYVILWNISPGRRIIRAAHFQKFFPATVQCIKETPATKKGTASDNEEASLVQRVPVPDRLRVADLRVALPARLRPRGTAEGGGNYVMFF